MEFKGMVCQQCQMLETDENEWLLRGNLGWSSDIDDLREKSSSTVKAEGRVQDNKDWVGGKELEIKIVVRIGYRICGAACR